MKSPNQPVPTSVPLAELRRGEIGMVAGLADALPLEQARGSTDSLLNRLRDLGFVAGARCEVIARMWPVGDPMAVRIGGSTFALRRAEAAAIRVLRLQTQDAKSAQLQAGSAGAALA